MSKIGVSLKIAVTKIDKARLFAGKDTYLDCTVFIDPNNMDQYGNHGMITQDVSKEERAQGVKGNILGNCKVFWNEGGQQSSNGQANNQQPQQQRQQAPQQNQGYQNQQQQPQNQAMNNDFESDGIPF